MTSPRTSGRRSLGRKRPDPLKDRRLVIVFGTMAALMMGFFLLITL
jgi:hypothetical protein